MGYVEHQELHQKGGLEKVEAMDLVYHIKSLLVGDLQTHSQE